MTVRYRIRTSGGQELSFASQETFEDFVRSGDLSPDDLVYDRDTESWAPARTHPLVLDIQDELEAAKEAAAAETEDEEAVSEKEEPSEDSAFGLSLAPPGEGSEEDEAATGARAAPEGEESGASAEELDLDLALTEELSPEDSKRAFVEKLEAERRSDLEIPSIRDSLEGFTMEDSDSLGGMLQEAPPPAPKTDRPERRETRPPPQPREERERATARPEKKKGAARRIFGALLLLAVLGGGGYVGYTLLPGADTEVPIAEEPVEAPAEPVEVEPTPPPTPVIPNTVAAVRARAQERYLASTQAQLRALQPIPEVWPEGPYLAVPTDYPEVVDVWQSYVTTIRAVRASDGERHLAAYEAALDDAAVMGEERETRLAAGMAAFAETAPPRQAHFDRVEALATAAIQSHNALVEAEGLILYDPTGSTGKPAGIGQGTSGRDSESQLLLDQVLELLGSALDAGGEGPGLDQTVREWVWDGFLDAATGARPNTG